MVSAGSDKLADLSNNENKNEAHRGEEEKQDHYDSLPKSKGGVENKDVNADMIEKVNVKEPTKKGKEPIIQILQKSGLTEITPEIKQKLPSWEEVTSLYGSKPKIIGLDTCSTFQSTIPESDAYIGGSGMFNTGTNLLADLLLKYCSLPKRTNGGHDQRAKKGMLWHVPWGKHNPVSWRTHHKAAVGSRGIEQTHVLPIVVIKDPFHWMSSMCRHPYAASWHYTRNNCPNLVMHGNKPNPVVVPYRKDKPGNYDSLVGLWNDWYDDYLAVSSFPRLIIRYEDLLFHLEEVMTEVCHCGGGTLINHENGIVLISENAKAGHNNGSNGLLGAMLRYGFDDKRTETLSREDLKYAKDQLSMNLMNLFSYSYPKKDQN